MKFSLPSLLFWVLHLPAVAGHVPNLFLYPSQSLSGDWQTIVDPYESGFYDYRWQQRDANPQPNPAEAFFLDAVAKSPSQRIEYNFDGSPTLKVPGDWNTQKPELFYYEGSLWYRKKWDFYPAAGESFRWFLRFGAANYRADAYLNGKKLGFHLGGFTPFDFEVTDGLRQGSNSLVVRVDNKRHADAVPTLNTDWWNYGGLTRDVTLVHTPKSIMTRHTVRLLSEMTREIEVKVELSQAEGDRKIEMEIPELKVRETLTTKADGKASIRVIPAALELWSPESPKLYTVVLRHGGGEIRESIGFRTVRTQGRQILVNGKPVFLRGICIHEEFPLQGGGRVNSPEKARQLLTWAKQLNCNFVRLAHYPHHEAMTRLADEMGIMVWSEVPVYWTIHWSNPETYQNAENQVTTMIERDINRASIIIWSMANETPVNPARTDFLTRLVARTKSLDPSRLVSAAMEKHAKPGAKDVNTVEDPLAKVLDVVSFNQYVGWYDGLPEKCGRVRWEIPYEKPVFISEFGGGARQGLRGEKSRIWTEEFQEDLYRQSLPMLDQIDGLAGFSPWILMDFRSPKRLLPGVQDGFNRKGLISSEGIPKLAYKVLQDYYAKRAANPPKTE